MTDFSEKEGLVVVKYSEYSNMACQSGKLLVEVPRDIYLSYGHSATNHRELSWLLIAKDSSLWYKQCIKL